MCGQGRIRQELLSQLSSEGELIPPNTLAELRRDMERKQLVSAQIRQIEKARLEHLKQAPKTGPNLMVLLLGAIFSLGLKLRIPSRARVPLMRLMIVVCSPTRDLAFAMGALGIFLRRGRDGDHLAVLALAAQPTKKRAFQALSVEPVGLGASVLARYRNACGMNDVDLDCARSQPTREPEAVPARFKGDGNAVDLVSCLLRLRSPSLEQLQEFVLIDLELLQWLAFHARYDPDDEPAFFAQLQNSDIMLGITKQPSTTASIPSREWFSA